MDKETKKQLDAIEKTVYRIEQDTIKIRKELKELTHQKNEVICCILDYVNV